MGSGNMETSSTPGRGVGAARLAPRTRRLDVRCGPLAVKTLTYGVFLSGPHRNMERPNSTLPMGIGAAIVLQLLFAALPFQTLFETTAMPLRVWLRLMLAGLMFFFVVEPRS